MLGFLDVPDPTDGPFSAFSAFHAIQQKPQVAQNSARDLETGAIHRWKRILRKILRRRGLTLSSDLPRVPALSVSDCSSLVTSSSLPFPHPSLAQVPSVTLHPLFSPPALLCPFSRKTAPLPRPAPRALNPSRTITITINSIHILVSHLSNVHSLIPTLSLFSHSLLIHPRFRV